jgi:hypothetical protein
VPPERCEKSPAFRITLEPIQTQFDGGRFAQGAMELAGHFAR